MPPIASAGHQQLFQMTKHLRYLLGFLFVLVELSTKLCMTAAIGLLCKSRHASDSSDTESSFAPGLLGIECFLDVR